MLAETFNKINNISNISEEGKKAKEATKLKYEYLQLNIEEYDNLLNPPFKKD